MPSRGGPPSSARPPLTRPPRDLAAWTDFFLDADIPVLADTAAAIDDLRRHQDAVDANLLGETIVRDPLMTLKVLVYASMQRPDRVVTDIETPTSAVLMTGISPFFAAFGPQPSVEATLAAEPGALEGLRVALRRAHRSAEFALAIAVHRMDPDAAAIHTAALLHDFAELLLWCHAPASALRIRDARLPDSSLPSSATEREVLNVEVADLQQSLMRAWRLPERLIGRGDGRIADHAGARSVQLGVCLARHTAQGWENAAAAADVADIARLLNWLPPATLEWLRTI